MSDRPVESNGFARCLIKTVHEKVLKILSLKNALKPQKSSIFVYALSRRGCLMAP